MSKKKKHIIAYFLFPLTILYGIVITIRNKLFDLNILRSTSFDVPVLSVGNLAVGGTGKTPHIEYLVKLLKGQFKVAVLSRGYKRKTNGFMYVDPSMDYTQVGDEPLQMKKKFPDITVAVDKNRVNGINHLVGADQPDVVLLDDAFQHRHVKPGLSILLTDYNNPFYHDHLLPFGRLRDRKQEIKRANVVIVTKTPGDITPINKRIVKKNLNIYPYQDLFFTTLDYGDLQPVFQQTAGKLTKEACKKEQYGILMVTGIANPKPFVDYIRGLSINIQKIKFPDHHEYTKHDIIRITKSFNSLNAEKRIIITTEKDAMRLHSVEIPDEIKSVLYYVPVEVKFLSKTKEFGNITHRFAKEKKRNSFLLH